MSNGREAGRASQPRERRLAAIDGFGFIAEPAHHGLEQPPLDGIVVGDQYDRIHECPMPPPNGRRTGQFGYAR